MSEDQGDIFGFGEPVEVSFGFKPPEVYDETFLPEVTVGRYFYEPGDLRTIPRNGFTGQMATPREPWVDLNEPRDLKIELALVYRILTAVLAKVDGYVHLDVPAMHEVLGHSSMGEDLIMSWSQDKSNPTLTLSAQSHLWDHINGGAPFV